MSDMQVEPTQQHQWLQHLVGEWTFESECVMPPGQAPMKSRGSERVRSIGGLWIVAEGEGEMPGGGPCNMILTLGYDPKRARFVGTWIGSMMTQLWVYDGELDASGKTLSLFTEGPDFTASEANKTAKYKEVIELVSDEQRTFTSHMLGEDETWQAFMTARYTRRK